MLEAIQEVRKIAADTGPLSEDALLRLAVLRHQIGAARVQDAPDKARADPPEDLFPDAVGAPEISRDELTGVHLASGLLHHGVLVVRGMIDRSYIDRLKGLIDGTDWSAPQFPSDASGEPCPGSAPMKCSAASLQGLIEAYQSAGVIKVLADYLGEDPVLLSERLLIDRQLLKSGLPWHQDGAFFGANVGAVNSFLALDSCGVDATGLMVAAKRFKEVVGVEPGERAPLGYGNTIKHEDILELAGADKVITPALEPGDAILIDEMTLHRTGMSPAKAQPRAWAITWFFAPSRFPEQRHPLWLG